jgi:hypothetical protein
LQATQSALPLQQIIPGCKKLFFRVKNVKLIRKFLGVKIVLKIDMTNALLKT